MKPATLRAAIDTRLALAQVNQVFANHCKSSCGYNIAINLSGPQVGFTCPGYSQLRFNNTYCCHIPVCFFNLRRDNFLNTPYYRLFNADYGYGSGGTEHIFGQSTFFLERDLEVAPL